MTVKVPTYTSEYVPPILVVDSVVFQLQDDQLAVLLIKRKQEPFYDWRALPGGYCSSGETTTEAMDRILARKTGINPQSLGYIEQLYTFDTVARDPRGHAVSVTYMALGRDIQPVPSDTTQYPAFFPVGDLPKLAYDHASIIEYALSRLRTKVSYTNAIHALLPDTFTLSQLQTAYEAVLGKLLDKRNFRKKFLSLDLIQATDEMQQDGAHRPARLYEFCQKKLQTLERSFD
jgi:8-oxo-dGTP diphosphatase